MPTDKTNLDPAIRRSIVGGLTGALLAIAVGVGFLFLKFGLGLIHLSYDLPYILRPIILPQEAVIVYLDDDSHKELNQPRNAPWDRSLHARLIDRLTKDGAKAVVFDIVFGDASVSAQADEALARAIQTNGKVVLAADIVPSGYGIDGAGAKMVVPPYTPFMEAGAQIGSAEMNPDDDLFIRTSVPNSRDDIIPTLSWAGAKLAGAKATGNEENRFARRWLNYYGPPTTIPNISFYQLFITGSDQVPPGFFSNKTVFVGARMLTKYSGDRKDEFPTPYSRWAKIRFMPGVEIQATNFLNLMRGDWLRRSSLATEWAIVLASGLLFGIGLSLFRPLSATGLALLCATLITGLAYYLFWRHRMWFPWLIVVAAQIPVALLWSIIYNSITSYIQNRLLEQSLGMYLSPKQVQRILKEPGLRKPGGSKQLISILFSDIAGFSRISEQLDPQDLIQLLNNYYEATIRCIHQTEGTVVDIIGDAIFAIWNAPEEQPDHKERMVRAALMFQKNVTQFNGRQGSLSLRTRVGLHSGEVVVGNVGSSEHFDFTAIGENVNLASRLEGLNKQLGTDVLMTRVAIPQDNGHCQVRDVGRFLFKGFGNVTQVNELIVTDGPPEATLPWRESFAKALEQFRQKGFAAAEDGFKRTIELRGDDGPSKFYLKQIEELRHLSLPEHWAGDTELKEK